MSHTTSPSLYDHFRSILNSLSTEYLVPDLGLQTANFLFLLESPHLQELKYGAPVSGSSGLSMTRHLFDSAYHSLPMGRLLLQHRKGELVDRRLYQVGLMNASNLPMQAAAYSAQTRSKFPEIMEILESLRSANQRDIYPREEWNIVQDLLLANLRKRLTALYERRLILVPCGRFAQKFFRLSQVHSPNWLVVNGIPHPSYNGFSQPRYQKEVAYMKQLFEKVVNKSARQD
ncbi:hypothetical protein ACOJUR_03945 [Alicyclobacillus tolerans]|uniref:hypothetical protein n=1 Tax=Alicyclobacillus tolerans TaxID=90970 RepID=UPI003B7E14EF